MTTATTHRRVRRSNADGPLLKTCPDCAEEVRAAARKCRYCSHQFEPLVVVQEGDTEASLSATIEQPVVATEEPSALLVERDDAAVVKPVRRALGRVVPGTTRGRAIAVASIVLVIVALAAVLFVLRRADAQRFSERSAALVTRAGDVNQAIADLEAASAVDAPEAADDLRSELAGAERASSRALKGLGAISNEQRRTRLRSAARAEHDVYEEAARVLDLDVGDVTALELRELATRTAAYDRASRSLSAVSDTVRASDATELDTAPLGRALTAANVDYRARLAFATKRQAAFRTRNAKLTAAAKAANAYAGSFRSVLARYAESRNDLQAWISGVRSSTSTSYMEAYEVLGQQVSRRQQLRSEFAALTAPPELATAHGQLLRVVDRSIDATTAASTGIAEFQYDMSGEYSYFEQTPSWQRFQTESDSIGADYDSAVSSWNAALAALQKRLGALDKLPSLPADHAL